MIKDPVASRPAQNDDLRRKTGPEGHNSIQASVYQEQNPLLCSAQAIQ